MCLKDVGLVSPKCSSTEHIIRVYLRQSEFTAYLRVRVRELT